ncbi:MAG: SDR family oxidoreductase [Gammaproteobacteria bacterium]|nr:SDR family oxidoreductase [Gammaproteobacteria bacterium]
MTNLKGQVAFITGAGSGIGRGIAERLARDGADIFIADIDVDGAELTANLVTQLGRRAAVVKANVASQRQMQKAAAECVAKFGRLDIVAANAGIGRGGSILDMSLKDWQDQIDINLTGVFLTVQATAQQMVKLGHGGRIVCLSSLAALNVSGPMFGYSATKAGVAIMVRAWAQELGAHGITVNAIGPGVIETPLAQGLAGNAGGAIRSSLESRTPVGRVGKPADIAGLVSFLAGEDGAFMSGSYVLMDGGLRDARGNWEPEPKVMEEMQQHMQAGAARRARLQPLIDERE